MPPSSGEARLARPWPNSSRSGSWRVDTLIASATVADSRLSSAASAATATAGATSTRSSLHVTDGTVRVNSCDGSAPIVATVQVGQPRHHRGRHHGQQGDGHRGAQPGAEQDQHGHPGAEGQGGEVGRREPLDHRGHGRDDDVLVLAGGAERGRYLLQGDQRGDAEREPLDDRQRDEAHVASRAGQPHRDEEHARHQRHHGHAARAVLGHDGHEHHGHRTGRAGDLHVAAPEDRGHGSGDDGGHQAGGGPEARRDAERQGQRQGHHPDRDAGDHVAAGGAQHRAQVTAARPHGIQPGAQHVQHLGAGGCGAHFGAATGVRSSTSPPWSAFLVSRMARALASRSRTAGSARE